MGCHNGIVAEAFAERGCTMIDGFDLSPTAIGEAKARFADASVDAQFSVVDLTDGIGKALRCDRYDIVCYLGVHLDLLRQMGRSAVLDLEDLTFGLTKQAFGLRAPLPCMEDPNARITRSGFSPITELMQGNVGPSRVYERQA